MKNCQSLILACIFVPEPHSEDSIINSFSEVTVIFFGYANTGGKKKPKVLSHLKSRIEYNFHLNLMK